MYYVDELKEALETIDFERFDDVYFNYRDGNIETNIADIPPLCNILTYKDPEWEMEPHQEQKMYKMILLTACEHGYSNSLYTVLVELNDMLEKQESDAEWILKILSIEFEEKEENMNAFLDAFSKLDVELQCKIRKMYIGMRDLGNYGKRSIKILEKIGYDSDVSANNDKN